jgi:hypothetical protein
MYPVSMFRLRYILLLILGSLSITTLRFTTELFLKSPTHIPSPKRAPLPAYLVTAKDIHCLRSTVFRVTGRIVNSGVSLPYQGELCCCFPPLTLCRSILAFSRDMLIGTLWRLE